MTAKDGTNGKTPNSKPSEGASKKSSGESESLAKLDELLDAWDDNEEVSGVHIEELHVHHPTGEFHAHETPTKPYNKLPSVDTDKPVRTPSISPKARNITIIIVAVATGLATAMKILWEAWSSLKK
jgi:hypothetical protein